MMGVFIYATLSVDAIDLSTQRNRTERTQRRPLPGVLVRGVAITED